MNEKTATCPLCREPIDHLNIYCHASVSYTYTPGKPAGTEFGKNEIDDVGDPYDTTCPTCGDSLSQNQINEIEEALR